MGAFLQQGKGCGQQSAGQRHGLHIHSGSLGRLCVTKEPRAESSNRCIGCSDGIQGHCSAVVGNCQFETNNRHFRDVKSYGNSITNLTIGCSNRQGRNGRHFLCGNSNLAGHNFNLNGVHAGIREADAGGRDRIISRFNIFQKRKGCSQQSAGQRHGLHIHGGSLGRLCVTKEPRAESSNRCIGCSDGIQSHCSAVVSNCQFKANDGHFSNVKIDRYRITRLAGHLTNGEGRGGIRRNSGCHDG